jgi:hypothetical protein
MKTKLVALAVLATVATVAALAVHATGAGASRQAAEVGDAKSALVRVPALRGKRLPLAEVLIRRAGLRVGREDCDCTFGVVIKSNWLVCMQWPKARKLVRRGTRVATYSAREIYEC